MLAVLLASEKAVCTKMTKRVPVVVCGGNHYSNAIPIFLQAWRKLGEILVKIDPDSFNKTPPVRLGHYVHVLFRRDTIAVST